MNQSFMFILGICSIAQIAFLPGFIACRLLRLRGAMTTVVFAFALSMILNHALVVALVLLNCYKPIVLYPLFVVECLAACWLVRFRDPPDESIQTANAHTCLDSTPQEIAAQGPFARFTAQSSYFAAVLTLVIYAVFAIDHVGDVFTTWDAVGSWNPWAIYWSQGAVPPIWGTYPQLVPTAYSLTYVFTGNDKVQFFAKSIVPLFPLVTLMAIFDLAQRRRSLGLYLGTVASGILLFVINAKPTENMLFSGYADVPVSLFTTLVFYCILRAADASQEREKKRFLMMGAVFAVGASLTKQTGMYMAAVFPLLAYLLVLRGSDGMSLGRIARWLAVPCIMMLICIPPWYLYRYQQISSGRAEDNFEELVVQLHGSRTFAERIAFGFKLLREQLGGERNLILLTVLTLFSLAVAPFAWLYLLVTLPFTLIWAYGFSYSLRNLALAVPFMGMGAGVGLEQLALVTRRGWLWIKFWIMGGADGRQVRWIRLASIVIPLLVILNFAAFPTGKLLKWQRSRQKRIGDAPLNELLYKYHADRPVAGLIGTHYSILQCLPGFEDKAIHIRMTDFGDYLAMRNRPDVKYFLVPSWLDPSYEPKIIEDIRERVKTGEFEMIIDEHSWLYVRKLSEQDREYGAEMRKVERFVELNQYASAVEILKKMNIAATERPGRAYYLYAYCLHKLFDDHHKVGDPPPDDALTYYSKALDYGFDEFWVRYHRSLLLLHFGRVPEAMADLKRARSINPESREVKRVLDDVQSSSRHKG